MKPLDDDLSTARALVVDGNPTSRAILVNHLREFGVRAIEQCTRAQDARRALEFKSFDIVLCEQHFGHDSQSGQDLLDDLRRNQLLPFSTVFIMVTSEASYAKVAEAAESALDGYLLKPHTATRLAECLQQARMRKFVLQDIFAAIEAEDFPTAAALCMQRFEERKRFWLYAARIGAELLLRLDKFDEAQELYEAVIAAKTVPWAKLGVARSQLFEGDAVRAVNTLENLISEEPNFADAYDVMGRAQFELGNQERTLDAYKMACSITPHSISRLQSLGLMTYYAGDRAEAEKLLGKVARMGLDSKMFDCQTLVLLAFAKLESNDRKGLMQCREDLSKLIERDEANLRYQRLAAIVDALQLIMDKQFSRLVDAVRTLTARVKDPEFDFESASNLLSLLAQLATKAVQLDDVNDVVDTIGMRFCTNRAICELLVSATSLHPPYADLLRVSNAQILKMAETAMALSLAGDPSAAVRNLLIHGNETLNAKLITTAQLVLQKYGDKIEQAGPLEAALLQWRMRYGVLSLRPTLGAQKRPSGGVSLRIDTPKVST